VRSASASGPSATASSGAYRIGALDVLDFSVFKVPELTRTVQVSDSGTINLPLVGEVMAAGKTARELEQDLAKQLGTKYLQQPQVSVYVKEYNSQRVTIEGAIKKPGLYPVRGDLTLLQLVATAQGFESNSDFTVLVFREKDGKRSAARFDVDEIRSGRAQDPLLQPGDVVVAGSSAIKETFNNILKALPIAGVFAML
jgi:polysaccharide export outer membrane protein